MVKIKKEKAVVIKSVLGTNIKLDILVKDHIVKISVFKTIYFEVCRRGFILVTLTMWNLLSYVFNMLNPTIVTIIFIAIFLDLCRIFTLVKEESLVGIRGVGFQVTTKYLLLGVKTVFIPQEQVQHIFINEVIFRNRVIYVLSLLTKDPQSQETLIPLFFGTLPRLSSVKVMYKHLKAIVK